MRKPNFFILGAPKCGTTSLAAWLSEHPDVFMTDPKEPNFFNSDRNYRKRISPEEYENLFAEASRQHHVIGEASPSYLSSRAALPAILGYAEDPRFVVCIRNPVDMTVSLHGQLLRMGFENEIDFEKAWHLQNTRAGGRAVPILSQNEGMYEFQYRDICLLGSQIDQLYRKVSRETVFVLLQEDVQANPRGEYLRVLNFLEVPDDGLKTFFVHNAAKRLSVRFARLMMATQFKRLLRPFKDRLERPGGKSTVSDSFRLELARTFRDDVLLFQNLIRRDLLNWQLLCLDGVVR